MNNIPSIRVAGKFTAGAPYDKVVNPAVFYTVEAVRTIPEMEALKLDLFKMVFAPVGFTQAESVAEIATGKANDACVITLTSRGRGPVYVLSTFILTMPTADGVIYENMVIMTDLGPCPPSMKEKLNNALVHFDNWVKENIGIKDPASTLGTIPTRAYVSKATAESWENSRQLAIVGEPSDTVLLNKANIKIAEQAAYIQELEALVKTK